MKKSEKLTDLWYEYEKGKDYIDSLDMVEKTNSAYRFYEGDHWHGLKSGGEKMPIIEVIRPIVDYKTATVTANKMEAYFRPQENADSRETEVICSMLNARFSREWENSYLDFMLADIVKTACITGESYLYAYFEQGNNLLNGQMPEGNIRYEVIDNSNIMFANEQLRDIQKQPYILIISRKDVSTVKKEAKANGLSAYEINKIVPDDLKDLMCGDSAKQEVETDGGKCLCILKLYKKNGRVYMQKATKTCVYCKETPLPLKEYPVCAYVWTEKKGSIRGVGDVYKYIPNQIWINRLEAYRLISAKMFAFPKLVYTQNIVNAESVDAVGVALEVQDSDIRAAKDAVGYINPAPMSSDAKAVMEELVTHTKTAAGASDVALGNTHADNYHAILAVREASAAPLNAQTDKLKKFVEDMARLMLDFWRGYYPLGITAQSDFGESVIPHSLLEELKVYIRVDTTPTTAFSKADEIKKADALLAAKLITLEEYETLLPAGEAMKPKLKDIIEKRKVYEVNANEQIEL